MKKSSTALPLRSIEFLTINALADDVARWQADTTTYRALAQEAIQHLAKNHREIKSLRQQLADLRSELRRYIATQVRE